MIFFSKLVSGELIWDIDDILKSIWNSQYFPHCWCSVNSLVLKMKSAQEKQTNLVCNVWEQMEFLEYGMFGCLFVNFGQSFGHLWWTQRPEYKWLRKALCIVLVLKAVPKDWGTLLWCRLQKKSFLNMRVNADVLQEGTAGERRVESSSRHCWFLYEEVWILNENWAGLWMFKNVFCAVSDWWKKQGWSFGSH